MDFITSTASSYWKHSHRMAYCPATQGELLTVSRIATVPLKQRPSQPSVHLRWHRPRPLRSCTASQGRYWEPLPWPPPGPTVRSCPRFIAPSHNAWTGNH